MMTNYGTIKEIKEQVKKTNEERIQEIKHDLRMQEIRDIWLENDSFGRRTKPLNNG